MTNLLIPSGIIAIAIAWFVFRLRNGVGMFTSRSSGALFDLGLDVRRLPDAPRKKFFREAQALFTATKGKFPPKQLAMRFFTWYHTENYRPDPNAIVGNGSFVSSLILMRQWGAKGEVPPASSKNEMTAIVKFIYGQIDESGDDRKSRQTQKANLIKFAEANGLGKLELEKEIYGSLADGISAFKLMAAKEGLYEPEYAKHDISWCTGLFFYAALGMARNILNADYHPVFWNSLNHRMINEMLEEHRGLSYDEHERVAKHAFEMLEAIEMLVNANHSKGINQLLVDRFGTRSEQARLTLGKAFTETVDQCAQSYLPDFMEGLE